MQRAVRLKTTLRFQFSIQTRAVSSSTAGPSFRQLGLPSSIVDALSKAFPHIESPTPSQTALLKALIPPSQRTSDAASSGRSLILRDVTGSGKSLALLLGLLAQSRARRADLAPSKTARLTRLLLVPHSEVARQYEYWLDLLRACSASSDPPAAPDTPPMEIARTFPNPFDSTHTAYKGQDSGLVIPPKTDFLIATPSAFVEIVPQLSLSSLETIALDEADGMLYLPNTRFGNKRQADKWERHPPPLVGIMNELLRQQSSDTPAGQSRRKDTKGQRDDEPISKRIVVVSATANSVLRDWIVRRSGWIGSRGVLGERQLDWYDFSGSEQQAMTTGQEAQGRLQTVGRTLLPDAAVEHVFYSVDEEGMLVQPADAEQRARSTSPRSSAMSTEKSIRINLEPFFTAVSVLFALNRVTSALVIVPSTQSLAKTLDFFHSLEVPATTIEEARDLPADEPRLYVVSASSISGLDIPALEQVFVLPGTVDDAQSYLHVAGRVGRMGAGQRRPKGKVISLVRQNEDRDEGRVKRFWELLGIEGRPGEVPQLGGGAV